MRTTLLCLCILLSSCAGKPERPKVRLAVAGMGLQMWCLPIPFAQTLGFYKEEGLDVQLENLPSAGKAIQALVGGSVDVAGISYSQNIEIAAEGQRVRSFFFSTKRTSLVLIISPSANARISRAEDMNGAVLGVSSPGAAGQILATHYLKKHGVPPTAFSTVGIGLGASAIAAIESGRVDAAVVLGGDHFQLLKRNPKARILIDASTQEGMRESFGGDAYATGALGAKQEWLDRNPEVARKLAKAAVRALQWLQSHTPEEIRERLPEAMRSADADVDLEIIRWGKDAFTADGRMPSGAPENLKRFLDETAENPRSAKIDLAATWTNEYLPEAK